MPRPYTGKHRFRIVDKLKPNGAVYVYEQESWYDPDTKNTKYKHILKGIRDPQTGEVVPTRPKASKSTVPAAPAAAKTTHNAQLIIAKSVCENSGVYAEVMASLPDNRTVADQILTLAWYVFCNGATWPCLENWSRRYQSLLPYSHEAITEDISRSVFGFIGLHPEISLSIFKSRAASFGNGELLAWVSSVYPCASEDIPDENSIAGRAGQKELYSKVLFLYSVTSRQLVAFQKIPENASSAVSPTLQLVKVLGLQLPEILQENGNSSESNIGEMLHEKIHFLIRVDAADKLVNDLVKDCYDSLISGSMASIVYQAPEYSGAAGSVTARFPYQRKTVPAKKGEKTGETEWIRAKLNVFIYFSSYQKGKEDRSFRKRFAETRENLITGAYLNTESRQFAEQYFNTRTKKDGTVVVTPKNAKVKDALKYHGFLVLLTDKEADLHIALMKYRIREKIEKAIAGHHSYPEEDPPCSDVSGAFPGGELLVEFLGNSMRESFGNRIHSMKSELGVCNGDSKHDSVENLKLENSLKDWIRASSSDRILQTFQATELLCVSDKAHTYQPGKPITARNRLFLERLGVRLE